MVGWVRGGGAGAQPSPSHEGGNGESGVEVGGTTRAARWNSLLSTPHAPRATSPSLPLQQCWYYAQTNGATFVWGGSNTTEVAVYPGDVPFSSAAGGYASPFTTSATNPTPRINP